MNPIGTSKPPKTGWSRVEKGTIVPTRNINLTQHLDYFVERQVASGRYSNASEIVRASLQRYRSMARISSFALFFLGLCLSRPALADESTRVPRATTPQVQHTVERAIGYLQTESAAWLRTRKCAACHHAPLPLWALSEAGQQGYAIDRKFLADTAAATLGSLEKMIDAKLVSNPADPPDPRPSARGVNMGTVFMAVAAQSFPVLDKGQKQSLRLITDEIVKKQRDDGSWEFFANLRRPPINESQTTDAVWIILALQGEMGRDATQLQRAALKKATAWLAGARLSDNLQDKVLHVLLALRAGKSRHEMQIVIDALLARQRSDGGWSQTATMTSDAFATGQTLYVLALAGYTAEQPDIQRAINFLVATQKPDGSWPMTSRSTPDGKPGSAKLLTPITCAAAAWATLGLARLAPKRP
jgi:hypothetical protein